MLEEVNHPFYTRSALEEADAVAWVFTKKDGDMQMYPFKFPPLSPTDVRIKITYTSICQSDIMHARGYWGITSSIQVTSPIPAVQGMRSLER